MRLRERHGSITRALLLVSSLALLTLGCTGPASRHAGPRPLGNSVVQRIRGDSSPLLVPGPWGNHGIVLWLGWKDLASMTDAQLDTWHRHGVTAIVAETQNLAGLGGTQHFSTRAPAGDSRFQIQSDLTRSGIAARARTKGIRCFLAFYFANPTNTSTPLAGWFDDAAWSGTVVPDVRDVAAAARAMGFAGVAFDQELYPQNGNVSTATWAWDYPGNTHTQSAVRSEAALRGRQVMRGLLAGFPGLSIVAYDTLLPDTWEALVEKVDNSVPDPYADSVQLNFWDGLTSVDGYGPVMLLNAVFYKMTNISGAGWDEALAYEDRSVYSFLSRHLSNWSYAATRLGESPFAWINSDPHGDSYSAARPPSYVARQLSAFRRWSTGGVFGIYNFGPLSDGFDYRPYFPAMDAATKGSADPPRPSLSVGEVRSPAPGTFDVSGVASDSLAVRAVLCGRPGGPTTAATMTWKATLASSSVALAWSCQGVRSGNALLTVTAIDITGAWTEIKVRVET